MSIVKLKDWKKMELKVLVVDDDLPVMNSLVAYLEDFDFDVEGKESAEAALDQAKSQSFDFGIIDLRLPKMDGEELIHELHYLNPNMKFVIHTGSTEFILTDGLRNIGMKQEHILNKPLPDLHVLIEHINQLIT